MVIYLAGPEVFLANAHEIGAGMLDRLVSADGPPALHARLRMLDRELEDALGGAHHLRGARERARVERRRDRGAPGHQAVLGRHLDVVERHREELLPAHRVERHARDTRPLGRHHEHRKIGPRAHDHEQHVGDVRVLDEELAPGEAAALACKGHGVEVEGARLLHERHRRDAVAGRHRAEEAFALLLIRAREQKRRRDDRARDVRAGHRRVAQLLHQ